MCAYRPTASLKAWIKACRLGLPSEEQCSIEKYVYLDSCGSWQTLSLGSRQLRHMPLVLVRQVT